MNKNMNMNMKIEKSMEVDELHSYQPTRRSRSRSRSRSRKTPSFSSSLLDSILRSIDDETNYHHNNNNIPFPINSSDPCNYKPTPPNINYIHSPQSRDHHQHIPTLRRDIMIDKWMETQNNNNNNNRIKYGYNNILSSARNVSYWDSISISSGNATSFTTSSSSSSASSHHDQQHPHTPSTYTSLPNSFTISPKHAQHIFLHHDSHYKPTPPPAAALRSLKFIKSTKLRAINIYHDLKKLKQQQQQQPISPATRISTFLYSLFAIKNKSKLNQTLKKSPSPSSTNNKRDSTTCTSFSRSTSMMSNKKQHNTTNNCITTSTVKRSVRFFSADKHTLILDRKSINERVIPLPKYETPRFTHNKYMKNYKTTFMQVNVEDDDDEDDLFEPEIIGGVASVTYGRELPVFETTDLTKIRI